MDNLEAMDKFLERYNLPRLNQEEIENMNRPMTSNEIETVIKNLPANGTSLVVQWLRISAPNEGGLGSIPGHGTRSQMHAATKSLHASTKKDPACRN